MALRKSRPTTPSLLKQQSARPGLPIRLGSSSSSSDVSSPNTRAGSSASPAPGKRAGDETKRTDVRDGKQKAVQRLSAQGSRGVLPATGAWRVPTGGGAATVSGPFRIPSVASMSRPSTAPAPEGQTPSLAPGRGASGTRYGSLEGWGKTTSSGSKGQPDTKLSGRARPQSSGRSRGGIAQPSGQPRHGSPQQTGRRGRISTALKRGQGSASSMPALSATTGGLKVRLDLPARGPSPANQSEKAGSEPASQPGSVFSTPRDLDGSAAPPLFDDPGLPRATAASLRTRKTGSPVRRRTRGRPQSGTGSGVAPRPGGTTTPSQAAKGAEEVLVKGGPASDKTTYQLSLPSARRRAKALERLRNRTTLDCTGESLGLVASSAGDRPDGSNSGSEDDFSDPGTTRQEWAVDDGSERGASPPAKPSSPASRPHSRASSICHGRPPTGRPPVGTHSHHDQPPSMLPAYMRANVTRSGYLSPFQTADEAPRPNIKDVRGIEAQQRWMGLSSTVGIDSLKRQPGLASIGHALMTGRTQSEKNVVASSLADEKARAAARAKRRGMVDLATGTPEEVSSQFMISSLQKTTREFDTEWMREAYQRGGRQDAITHYSPIPIADTGRLHRSGNGNVKLRLFKELVGATDLDSAHLEDQEEESDSDDHQNDNAGTPDLMRRIADRMLGRKTTQSGLSKLIQHLSVSSVSASPFVAKEAPAPKKATSGKDFILNFEFSKSEAEVTHVKSDTEASSDTGSESGRVLGNKDVWQSHHRLPGTGLENGFGTEPDEATLAVMNEGDAADYDSIFFGDPARQELAGTYRKLTRRASGQFDVPIRESRMPPRPVSRRPSATPPPLSVPKAPTRAIGDLAAQKKTLDTLPSQLRQLLQNVSPAKVDVVPTVSVDGAGPKDAELSLGFWERVQKNSESPPRTPSRVDTLKASSPIEEHSDRESIDTAAAFDFSSQESSLSSSDSSSSEAYSPADDSDLSEDERLRRKEIRDLKAVLAKYRSKQKREAGIPARPIAPTKSGSPTFDHSSPPVRAKLRRMKRKASSAFRRSQRLQRERHSSAMKSSTADRSPSQVHPVIAAHYADEFPGTQSVVHSYLRYCRDHGIAPEPLIVRKKRTTTLDLGHFSIGSTRAQALTQALGALPLLQHLNLRDNRLKDNDASALLEVVSSRDSLLSIDLSENQLGSKTADALVSLIRATSCLSRLCLSSNTLGTVNACKIAQAIAANESLTLLDMSRNKIGPSASAALGHMVEGCDLEELDLSWNNLGNNGIVDICRAVGENAGPLRWLDLSWNGIGEAGAGHLSTMLKSSTALAHLDLSNNSITPKGGMVLADGVNFNTSILSLQLNSNPLGGDGCRALMRAMRKERDIPRSIGLERCTMQSSVVFDPNSPGGTYSLDLSVPYNRIIVQELVRLAEESTDIHFLGARWIPPGGRKPKEPIGTPFRSVVKLPPVKLDDTAVGTGSSRTLTDLGSTMGSTAGSSAGGGSGLPVYELSKRKPTDVVYLRMVREMAKVKFSDELWKLLRGNVRDVADWIADQNRLGGVSKKETLGRKARRRGNVVKAYFMEIDMHHEQLRKAEQMEETRRRKEEAVERARREEMELQYGKTQKKKRNYEMSKMEELAKTNKDISMSGIGLKQQRTFDSTRKLGKTRWEDEEREEGGKSPDKKAQQSNQWEVPSVGTFEVVVRQTLESKEDLTDARKGARVTSLIHLFSDNRSAGRLQQHDKLKLLELASMDMAIMAQDAAKLMQMDVLQKSSSGQRVRAMSRLLFRLVDPSQAMRLLNENLSVAERREVQSVLGQAFRLLIGQSTGHYTLNLADPQDRDVLVRLLAVNREERNWLRTRYPTLDTSQKGNTHRFRNEKLDGMPIEVTPKSFEEIPQIGILELDFVTARRPSVRAKPMHPLAFPRLLRRAGVYSLLSKLGISLPSVEDSDSEKEETAAAGAGGPSGEEGDEEREREADLGNGEGEGEAEAKEDEGKEDPEGTVDPESEEAKGDEADLAGKSAAPAPKSATKSTSRRRSSKGSRDGRRASMTLHDGFTRPAYRGPPYHLSALTEVPNENPLPPYDDYVPVKRRNVYTKRAIDTSAARKKSKKKKGDDGPVKEGVEYDMGWLKKDVAPDKEFSIPASAPEFHPKDFPEVFARSKFAVPPKAPDAVRMEALVVLTDLISMSTHLYFSARQLSDLVRMFPPSLPGFRVELVIALFSRVVNLNEFHRVLFALSLPERLVVRHRLGWLNLWDPMRPDGTYTLDLSVWEDRVVAHALTQLAVAEPGENWVEAKFGGIVGWRLPRLWLQSMPTSGLLEVTYTSLEPNCDAVWSERRRQCRKTLTYC